MVVPDTGCVLGDHVHFDAIERGRRHLQSTSRRVETYLRLAWRSYDEFCAKPRSGIILGRALLAEIYAPVRARYIVQLLQIFISVTVLMFSVTPKPWL